MNRYKIAHLTISEGVYFIDAKSSEDACLKFHKKNEKGFYLPSYYLDISERIVDVECCGENVETDNYQQIIESDSLVKSKEDNENH